MGTPHLAVGGVCALQHYAGRFLQPVIALWAMTGSAMDLRPDRWWALVDDDGATRMVSCPDAAIAARDVSPAGMAQRILGHVETFVAAVCETTGIVERVALGGVAASVAGAAGTAHRGLPLPRRADFRDRVSRLVDALGPVPGRPLATLVEIDVAIESDTRAGAGGGAEAGAGAAETALTHDRHTCCLIRLGRDERECGTCPHLSLPDRRARQRRARRSKQIDLGVGDVPARN